MAPVISRSTKPTPSDSASTSAAAEACRREGREGVAWAPGPRSGRGLGLNADPGARANDEEARLRERGGARRMACVVLTIKRLT